MPVRPYHDDNLPSKQPFGIESATKTAAIVVGVLVTVLVLGYR